MSEHIRPVKEIIKSHEVVEGAGVKVRRTIALPSLDYVDPFLLLDEFKSDNSGDYIAGFPWHPHRGIETVTFMIAGRIEHGDSMGNSGVIGPGDVQWMTAGKGIVHQEMPKTQNGMMWGLQLWVNLPKKDKLCPPRYQDIPAADIPSVPLANGATVRVVCGELSGKKGPVSDIAANPTYLDVSLPKDEIFNLDIVNGYSVFCYTLDGTLAFEGTNDSAESSSIILFGEGNRLSVKAERSACRFIVVSGRILNEPIARGGPFVMNTRQEIFQAYQDYQDGTFIK